MREDTQEFSGYIKEEKEEQETGSENPEERNNITSGVKKRHLGYEDRRARLYRDKEALVRRRLTH